MQLIKDNFLLSTNPDLLKTMNILGLDGKPLYIDTDFNPYDYATRFGTVAHVPKVISNDFKYDNPILVNDVVLCHHFVAQPNNEVQIFDEVFYKASYYHIFAKLHLRTIVPLEDFMFVLPLEAQHEDKFIGKFQINFDENSPVKQKGIIASLSNQALASGLQLGDTIYFTKNANYKMNVGNQDYYRMRIRNAMLVERDGQLICLNDRVLIKTLDTNKRFSSVKDKACFGEVVDGDIPKGAVINYTKGLAEIVAYKGEEYTLIRKDKINYIQ